MISKALLVYVILNLQPKAEPYAMMLAEALDGFKCADSEEILAIAMAESSLLPAVSPDLGIFQISRQVAEDYSYDTDRVIFDLKYATNAACEHLERRKLECAVQYPKTAYACYHSATPKYHKLYVKKIEKIKAQISKIKKRFK